MQPNHNPNCTACHGSGNYEGWECDCNQPEPIERDPCDADGCSGGIVNRTWNNDPQHDEDCPVCGGKGWRE